MRPGVLVPEKGALGGIFGIVLQPADGGFRRGVGEAVAFSAIQAQQFAQNVDTGIARTLRQHQPGTGDLPRFFQPFLGQPLPAGGFALLAGPLPFLAQKLAAQTPGEIALLVLIERVGIVHHPQQIVAVRRGLRFQIALQRHLRQGKRLIAGGQRVVHGRVLRPARFVGGEQLAQTDGVVGVDVQPE